MAYSENILPIVASGYELTNATLVNGVLSLAAGGSAKCTITEKELAVLTETFRIHMLPSAFTSSYAPSVYMYIAIQLADGTYLNTSCVPTVDASGIYSADITLNNSEYTSFTVTIYAENAVSFTLWEMCPELKSDVSVIIDGVTQSLPKLLYDRNYEPFIIGQTSTQVANITYYLQNGTDLQGHLLLSYVASLPCTLTLHFIDNDASELFCPLTYDIHAGRGSIGVPHSYLNRLAGLHSTYVTARVSAGTLTVGTCGMLFTLDGGYLAKRLISLGTDVRDIAVRQISAAAGPDQVWSVGIDEGYLIIRKGAFSNRQIDFEPVSTIAGTLNAAIEFDGSFVIKNEAAYTIETNAEPYIFYTDTNKTLYVKYGTALSTPIQLDTDVEAISVCRGYKAPSVPENDQGLICTYIKTNGNVYYKYYAYSNDGYYWLGPIQLRNNQDAISVHIHRLNDYRVGIVVTTNTENIWYISDRTYVEQAVKPEQATFNLYNASAACHMMNVSDSYTNTLNATIDNFQDIYITSNYPLYFYYPLKDSISISLGEIESIVLDSQSTVHIHLKQQIYRDITVTFKNTYVACIVNNNHYFLGATSILVVNGIKVTEQASYKLTQATATATLTQISNTPVTLRAEYANIALTNAVGSITMTAISYDSISILPEYASYALTSASATATLTKVGVEPI